MKSEVLSLPVPVDLLRARRLEWIGALESGQFRQGQGALFNQHVTRWDSEYPEEAVEIDPDTESFCCLGVARRVITPTWMVGELVESEDGHRNYERVSNHLQLDGPVRTHLIDMNDDRGRSFPFIARFLRKIWGLSDV